MVLLAVLVVFLSIGMGAMILKKNIVGQYANDSVGQKIISYMGMVCRFAAIYLFVSGMYVAISGNLPAHYVTNGTLPYVILTILMAVSLIAYPFAHRIAILQYCAKKMFG